MWRVCDKHSNLEDDFNAIFMFKSYIIKLLANIRAKRKQKELSLSYLITKVYQYQLIWIWSLPFYSVSETELEEGIYSQKQQCFLQHFYCQLSKGSVFVAMDGWVL